MKEPPTPTGEDERLSALAEYGLLDIPNEEVFDAFARVAANSCGTPFGVIALAARDALCFKSHYGLSALPETPLAGSFCSYAIRGREILEVPDARRDPRFASNARVTGGPNLVFYAGAPLITASGIAIGTISVLDTEPHTLTKDQRAGLRAIADAVAEQFEMRRRLKRDQSTVNERLHMLSAAMEATEEAVVI